MVYSTKSRACNCKMGQDGLQTRLISMRHDKMKIFFECVYYSLMNAIMRLQISYGIVRSTVWYFCPSNSRNNCKRAWSFATAWSILPSAKAHVCKTVKLCWLWAQASASSLWRCVMNPLDVEAIVFSSCRHATSTSSSCPDAWDSASCTNTSRCS